MVIAAPQIAITREGPERKKGAIAVIAKIEHAGKAHRRVPFLIPQPMRLLPIEQKLNTARDGGMIGLARHHQRQQRPGGLRSGAFLPLAMGLAGVVGFAALAPAAVTALLGKEPLDCSAY